MAKMDRVEFAQKILLRLLYSMQQDQLSLDRLVKLSYEIADSHNSYGSQDFRSVPKAWEPNSRENHT